MSIICCSRSVVDVEYEQKRRSDEKENAGSIFVEDQERFRVEQYLSFLCGACGLANMYNYDGRFKIALDVLEIAEKISRDPEVFSSDRFALLHATAEIRIATYFLTNRGRDEMFDAVQKVVQEAQNACVELDFTEGNSGNTMDIASALCLLGQAHYYATLNTNGSAYGSVFDYCSQSLALWEKLEQARRITMTDWDTLPSDACEVDENAKNYVLHMIQRGMSQPLLSLGLAHERLAEKEQARACYQRALDLALHANAKEEAALAYRSLAGLSEEKEEQLVSAFQSLRLYEEIGFKRALPHAHVLICDLYLQRHDLEKAQEYCLTAFQLAEEMQLKHAMMMASYSQGEIYQREGRREEAQHCFVQGADIARELGISYGIAEGVKKWQASGYDPQDGLFSHL